MNKRNLKLLAVPTIYAIAILVFGTSMYLIQRAVNNSRFESSEDMEYVDKEIVTDNEYIPVVVTENTIMRPFLNNMVTINKVFYKYDDEAKKSQKEREDRAKERIFGMLPPDQEEELKALFEEFEEGASAEARFARAMDNLQPLLLNNSNDGNDWKEHGVSASQVYNRQKRTEAGSAKLYEVTEDIIKDHIAKGNLADG